MSHLHSTSNRRCVTTDSSGPVINIRHNNIKIVGCTCVRSNVPVRKGYPFFATIASDGSVNKVIDDIEWHEITVWAFNTLAAASTKGAIMKLGDQRTRLERRRGWYAPFP